MPTESSRLQAERDRQSREKRLFLSIAGIGFAASLLAAVALGHRRAHKAALAAGESIQGNHVNWAMRAFAIGTLYAVGFVGMSTAAASYYLQEKNVKTTGEFSSHVKQRIERIVGPSLMERMGIKSSEDQAGLDRIDRMISETDEETGEKKIKFARIKRLVGNDQGQVQNDPDSERSQWDQQPEKLSLGARMRKAFGFGKDNA
ncbi:hypothetical protein J3B02_004362 [Coemansia erecta]|uniref:Transmembrane protein 242 n=1 Tax=Coemansia asiatica TaxID=1052880 RepID=A0A9W7XL53_9FUNG|nr:hypothetical protein LPJ64_003734 [Coemansia asiatica]KAJ2846629.1 hypothetical protein J3B02_004362 [Coemansia erecta]KAJ2868216.1 hypothetical protein FB639_004884 [Coemansia asiatica]